MACIIACICWYSHLRCRHVMHTIFRLNIWLQPALNGIRSVTVFMVYFECPVYMNIMWCIPSFGSDSWWHIQHWHACLTNTTTFIFEFSKMACIIACIFWYSYLRCRHVMHTIFRLNVWLPLALNGVRSVTVLLVYFECPVYMNIMWCIPSFGSDSWWHIQHWHACLTNTNTFY